MARTTIMGSAGYQRKDNRIEDPVITISIEDGRYQTLDWGLGGFRVKEYDGTILTGQEFLINGIGPAPADVFAVRVDCEAIRVAEGTLAASFVELTSDAYDILEALMMRRQKNIDRLREKFGNL